MSSYKFKLELTCACTGKDNSRSRTRKALVLGRRNRRIVAAEHKREYRGGFRMEARMSEENVDISAPLNTELDQITLCKIANRAFKVVGRLLKRDQLIAEKLRNPSTASRQIFREECITTEMAATLKERFPREIDLVIFTPAEEAKNGADWYWRIQKGANAIHAMVQAKRVQRREFGQPDGKGTIAFDIAQLERLLNTVTHVQQNLPGLQAWIASFVRVNALPPCGRNPHKCASHGCSSCERRSEDPSVWIAHADKIMECKTTSMPISKVVEHSLRLDCILPCIPTQSSGPGPAKKGFVLAPEQKSFDDCVTVIQNDPGLKAQFHGAIQIKV